MPFVSKAQQRWAFANKEPFAKRWAKQTNFAKIPNKLTKRAPKARALPNKLRVG